MSPFQLIQPVIRFISSTLALLLLLGLAGCASDSPAPVDSLERGRRSTPIQGAATHRVQQGDTLYSIAWRYDLDYHRLARWNGIDSSYKIYPGQLLRLKPAAPATVTAAAKPPAATKVAPKPKVKPKPTPKPKPTASPSPPKAQVKAKASGKSPPAQSSSDGLKWIWPTRGKVVQTFVPGDRTRQGIRIAGTAGQPVVAAESGKVVYSGSGLPGYGKLIIVKHNKNYLSAYGFNRKLLVKDGDQVTRGERVAEMGQSADGKPMLHFEIRRRDKAVDPLKLLPR